MKLERIESVLWSASANSSVFLLTASIKGFRSRLNDSNSPSLIRIAIEGPELLHVDFNEFVDIFKEKHRIEL